MRKILYLFLTFALTYSNNVSAIWSGEADKAKENTSFILSFFTTEMLLNFIFAVVVIILTIFISKIVTSRIESYMLKSWNWENREELIWVLTRTSNITILLIWFSITLGILWVDMWIFMWGLWFWLGFTLKIFFSNFIAWVIMVTQGSYHNWDLIEIDWKMWHIKKINALFTEVEQFDWIIFYVPNVKFLENNVQNYHANSKRRIEVNVWVDYKTDLVKAKKVILQVLSNFPSIMKAPEAEVLISDFENSSINIKIWFWVDSRQWEYFTMKSNVTETINLAFKQAWIIIPFPQITLSNREDFKLIPSK